MSRNAWRYVAMLLMAAAGGIITAASHQGSTLIDYFRDSVIACGPTFAALKMTLEQELGVKENGQAKGMGA